MRVTYKGREKGFEYRLAEITFNEKEETLVNRLIFLWKG